MRQGVARDESGHRPPERWPMLLAFGAAVAYLTTIGSLLLWVAVLSWTPGWSAVLITSGSMAPALSEGDVVLIDSDVAPGEFTVGMVVTFPGAGSGELVTHRIAGSTDDGALVTRGDANPTNDSSPIAAEQVAGVGRMVVPGVGLPRLWGSTNVWLLVAFLLTTAAAIAVVARSPGRQGSPPGRGHSPGQGKLLGLVIASAVAGLVSMGLANASAAFLATTANQGSAIGAGSWCTNPGTYRLSADADAGIELGDITRNRGDDETVRVKGKAGDDARAYVQMDLSSLPTDCVVRSAYLRLQVEPRKDEPDDILVQPVEAPWFETGITWENQPETTGTASAQSFGVKESASRYWDVTDDVSVWLDGTLTNNGWRVFSANEDTGDYDHEVTMRESDGATITPELIVNLGVSDATSCGAPGAYDIAIGADAYVQQDNPAENQGTDSEVKAKLEAGKERRIVMRADLASLPSGCTVEFAELQATVESDPSGDVLLYRAIGSWTESAVTWLNQPSTAAPGVGVDIADPDNKRYTWDVTGHVIDWLENGVANDGWRFDASTDDERRFKAREDGSPEKHPRVLILLS